MTIAEYNSETNSFRLKFPNHEVKTALNQQILALVANTGPESADYIAFELKSFLNHGDIEGTVSCLKMLFSPVPISYTLKKNTFITGCFKWPSTLQVSKRSRNIPQVMHA